ncbi:amino acid permease [Bacillus cereus]|uniref:APC family permease n=1 Tax=Bacillus cereus TaxID=1396 RepID=UPI0009955D54|nr:amino acid permease [Bacillus cereus]OPA21262.1 amino acid permease [Bacillus cereus]
MENKSINLYQAIALYIASILGSGVLFLSASTANIAGPASIISWGVVIIFSFPLAYTFASLSRNYSDAGGAATFVRMAFGDNIGNIIGWAYFFCAAVGQIIVSLTGAFYLGNAFGLADKSITFFALLILFTGSAFNYQGLKLSGKFSLFLSTLLVLVLIIVIVSSFSKIELSNFKPFFPKGISSIGTCVTLILWSFFGWEAICNLSDKFLRPEKDIVKGAIISAGIIGILFIMLSIITVGTYTYGNPESNMSPIGILMEDSIGIGAKYITAVLAFIICLGTVNAFIASLTQLGFALSRDGAFPKYFSKKNPKTHTSTRVIILIYFFASIGVILVSLFKVSYIDLLFIPNSLGIMVYIFSTASAIKLFNKGTLQRRAAIISFTLCLSIIPFFGKYVFVPVIVIIFYYIYFLCTRQKGS